MNVALHKCFPKAKLKIFGHKEDNETENKIQEGGGLTFNKKDTPGMDE